MSHISSYGGVFLWKTTQILNNPQLNLIFIIMFVFLILKIYNINFKNKFHYPIIFIYYINFYFNIYNIDFYSSNMYTLLKKINLALLNGLVVIHPWLTFILYSYIIFILYNIINSNKIYKILFLKNSIKYTCLILIITAIFLGSWWSYQELSWGGWWSWDVVELVSLNFFFACVFFIHVNHIEVFKKKNILIKLILLLLLSFIIIRFNLLSSIHTFVNNNGTKFFLFKYVIFIIYLTCFIYILVCCVFLNKTFFLKKNYLIYFNSHIIIIILIITMYLIILLIRGVDFLELNIFFEFFFLYSNIYFLLYINPLKNNSLRNININIFTINYLYFIVTLCVNTFFKKLPNSYVKNHNIILVLFIVMYCLKIYTSSASLFTEYNVTTHNFVVSYNSNYFYNMINHTNINFYKNEFIYTNNKFFNFSNIKAHHYKNYILNLNSFFIKILQPNTNIFILINKNIFLFILILKPFILIKFFKKIFIN